MRWGNPYVGQYPDMGNMDNMGPKDFGKPDGALMPTAHQTITEQAVVVTMTDARKVPLKSGSSNTKTFVTMKVNSITRLRHPIGEKTSNYWTSTSTEFADENQCTVDLRPLVVGSTNLWNLSGIFCHRFSPTPALSHYWCDTKLTAYTKRLHHFHHQCKYNKSMPHGPMACDCLWRRTNVFSSGPVWDRDLCFHHYCFL